MSKFKILTLSAVVAMGLTSVASAVPTYTVWTSVPVVLDNLTDLNVVGGSLPVPLGGVGGPNHADPGTNHVLLNTPGAYMVDLFVTVENADPGFTYGGITFDIVLSGGASQAAEAPDYLPSFYGVQNEDSNGAGIGGTVGRWDENADQGALDLLGITVWNAIGANAADTRRTLGTTGIDAVAPIAGHAAADAANGQPRRHYAGTFFFNYDGTPGLGFSINYQTTINLNLDTAQLANDTSVSIQTPSTITFVPEPASIALLGLGGLALLARRRSA